MPESKARIRSHLWCGTGHVAAAAVLGCSAAALHVACERKASETTRPVAPAPAEPTPDHATPPPRGQAPAEHVTDLIALGRTCIPELMESRAGAWLVVDFLEQYARVAGTDEPGKLADTLPHPASRMHAYDRLAVVASQSRSDESARDFFARARRVLDDMSDDDPDVGKGFCVQRLVEAYAEIGDFETALTEVEGVGNHLLAVDILAHSIAPAQHKRGDTRGALHTLSLGLERANKIFQKDTSDMARRMRHDSICKVIQERCKIGGLREAERTIDGIIDLQHRNMAIADVCRVVGGADCGRALELAGTIADPYSRVRAQCAVALVAARGAQPEIAKAAAAAARRSLNEVQGPGVERARGMVGEALTWGGDIAEGRAVLDSIPDTDYYVVSCFAAAAEGATLHGAGGPMWDEAVRRLAMVRDSSELSPARMSLASAMARSGMIDDATARGLQITDGGKESLGREIASAALRKGDTAAAVRGLKQLRVGSRGGWQEVGVALARAGDYEQIKSLSQSLDSNWIRLELVTGALTAAAGQPQR
ncbi:MAG: hypothetical protein WAZ94_04385 [Phycisphaerales bacterium]